MSEDIIWRYMSLVKYVDLLRLRAIFFPKASLFHDEFEGMWIAHAILWGEKQKWQKIRIDAEKLQALLEKANGDQEYILQEAKLLLGRLSVNESKGVYGDVLKDLMRVYPHKREEYLRGIVESWIKHHDNYNSKVQDWSHQVTVNRESTYISCWNRSDSMSLAMWNLYGGGTEAVALSSSVTKLKAILDNNSNRLQDQGFDGEVVDVHYVNGLNEPGEDLRGDLIDRLSVGKDVRVGEFSIKPSIYEYEREVRAILYPKRGLFDPIINPHPDLSGISLPIEGIEGQGSIRGFLDSVHVYPLLNSDSMMVRVVQEINAKFGLPDLPIVADEIEAIGPNMILNPAAKRSG